jgi:hypothetical protein
MRKLSIADKRLFRIMAPTPPSPMLVCSTCCEFRGSRLIRNITIAALDETAIGGCSICSLIRESLLGMFDEEDIIWVSIDNLPSPRGPKNSLRVLLRPNYRPKDPRLSTLSTFNQEVLQFFVLPGNDKFYV